MTIDGAQLIQFSCIPGRKVSNVPQLRYQGPDGSEFALAQKVTKAFWSKLAKLDEPPAEPLRTFVLAFPIAEALGYRRSGEWDEEGRDGPE